MFVSSRFKLGQGLGNIGKCGKSTDLIHDNGRLNPLSSPAIRAVQPLLDVRPKERYNIEMMRGTVEFIGTAFYLSADMAVTHLAAKAEKMSSKVFVRL